MNWWQYLLLVNVYLLLFYTFYALLLRNETFFRLNRIYLIASVVLSFLIPVLQASWLRDFFITRQIRLTIYQLDVVSITANAQKATGGISLGQLLAAMYLTGSMVLFIRFAMQLFKLKRSLNQAGNGTAFSFFNKVKVDKNLAQQNVIAAHEAVHARQWHSADVLLMELVTIINWFNPVVYLYRKAVKHIHEFIADNEVVSFGTSRQDYALLLLSHTLNAPVSELANSFFNHSLLKQRIMMLHKNPSQRTALLKYGLSAPLFALMVILSSATAKTTGAITKINEKATTLLEYQPGMKTTDVSDKTVPNQATVDVISKRVIKTSKDTIDNRLFITVQQSAEPAGGFNKFYRFLGKNIRYPAEARNRNIQGRVICQFVVEKNGALSDIKVVRGIGAGADEEAVRVLALSPKWTPGKEKGIPVRQQYTVPISFTLEKLSSTGGNGSQNTPPVSSTTGSNPVTITSYIDSSKNNGQAIQTVNSPEYYIDGVLATGDSWKKVNPKDILSINVVKAKPNDTNTRDKIMIITRH